MSLLHYLAYGSNLHPYRLGLRVPSSIFIEIVDLPGWKLQFHKVGKDHSGKCNLIYTGSLNDKAYGAIYEINSSEKPLLDVCENAGDGYIVTNFNLTISSGPIKAFCYLADPQHINDSLIPFDWYQKFVLAGCQFHNLPPQYINSIASHKNWPDPDQERKNFHKKILHSMHF